LFGSVFFSVPSLYSFALPRSLAFKSKHHISFGFKNPLHSGLPYIFKGQSLKNIKQTFIICVNYGLRINYEELKNQSHFNMNVHPSLVPRYRGATPVRRAIDQYDFVLGMSMCKMSTQVDLGRPVLMKRFINSLQTYTETSNRCTMESSYVINHVPHIKSTEQDVMVFPKGPVRITKATYSKRKGDTLETLKVKHITLTRFSKRHESLTVEGEVLYGLMGLIKVSRSSRCLSNLECKDLKSIEGVMCGLCLV
jgi:hypothetical protein